MIYETDPEDDWTDPDVWRRANPNLGVSINLDYLKRECQRAKDSPAYENTFRRLHLNQWTEQDVRWLNMDRWDQGAEPLPDLSGRECWAGLDLSTTTDLTALTLVFPNSDGMYFVLPYCWVPAENAHLRERRDRVPYTAWSRRGQLEMTEGDVVDYDLLRQRINELARQYPIREIAVDRWNAQHLITQLEGDGFQMTPFGQGYRDMSGPAKQLERLVIDGKLRHGGHPVLRWCAGNVTVEQDAAGNIKPSKAKSNERIDAIVALIMALSRAMTAEPESVYATYGNLRL